MSANQIRPPTPFNRIGPYLPTVIAVGIIGPALMYIIIMGLLGWSTPTIGSVGALLRGSVDRVYIYESPGTTTFFQQAGGNYETLLQPWRTYFASRKRPYTAVKSVDGIDKLKDGVLILPSAVALSTAERNSIIAFRSRGGSLLSTWATGTRSETGAWVGWDFLERVGATAVGELGAESDARQLVLTGESPVSHTHPAGFRIWMSKTSEPLLRLKGESIAGRFMSWARIPDKARADEGAIVFSEQESTGSRAVVLGFAESTWESAPLQPHMMFDDVIAWLQRSPVIVRAAWPNGFRSSQVIEMDTEEGFPNSLYFSALMKDAGIPASFYILTSVARQFPSVLKQLARDHEVGYHGEVHLGYKGLALPLQEKRIQNMIAEMSEIGANIKGLTGFRAPTEGYDATTEILIQKYGIRYHAADPERSEGRLPLLAKIKDLPLQEDLMVLPRTQRDDINLLVDGPTQEQLLGKMIADFDHASETGSFGFFSVHSQNFGANAPLALAFPAYIKHIQRYKKTTWFATGSQVSDWWRDRERLKVDFSNSGKRMDLNVTVTGTAAVTGASLILMMPQKGVVPLVRNTKVGIDIPTIRKIDDYRYSLQFEVLQAGNYAYQITYNGI